MWHKTSPGSDSIQQEIQRVQQAKPLLGSMQVNVVASAGLVGWGTLHNVWQDDNLHV